jgi:hypothetical protein
MLVSRRWTGTSAGLLLEALGALSDLDHGASRPDYGAPTVVLVLADKTKGHPVEDATLALGNMLNVADSLGLGSCWVHRTQQMFESEEGKARLKKWSVEGDYVGVGSCARGYPDGGHPEAAPRKADFVVMVRASASSSSGLVETTAARRPRLHSVGPDRGPITVAPLAKSTP